MLARILQYPTMFSFILWHLRNLVMATCQIFEECAEFGGMFLPGLTNQLSPTSVLIRNRSDGLPASKPPCAMVSAGVAEQEVPRT